LGYAVLLGVWAFNLGHLSMIRGCIAQIEILKEEVAKNQAATKTGNGANLLQVLSAEKKHSIAKLIGIPDVFGRGYFISTLIHLFIDGCASVALLSRVKCPF